MNETAQLFQLQNLSADVVVAIAGFAAFVTVMLVYRALLIRDPLAARMKGLQARRDALRVRALAPRRRDRRAISMGTIRTIVRKLNLLRTSQARKAGLRLTQAGWRSKDALSIYFFCKLCMPFVFGALVLGWIAVGGLAKMSEMMRYLIAMSAVVAGAYAPDVFVKNAITKRRQKILKGLPDGLDLMVICAEAGQSLDAALNRVAREIAISAPELAEELSLTAIELGLMPDRREALDNLNKRTDMPELRGVVNALLQTERYGTPLAQSLRVLAAEYRHNRLMRAEEKAARLPAILTVPMIIFILPALFIVLIGPAIVRTIDMLSKF
ncbi:MAG: type II secretion system F family protein [Rhodospirillales bacterium]